MSPGAVYFTYESEEHADRCLVCRRYLRSGDRAAILPHLWRHPQYVHVACWRLASEHTDPRA